MRTSTKIWFIPFFRILFFIRFDPEETFDPQAPHFYRKCHATRLQDYLVNAVLTCFNSLTSHIGLKVYLK